MAGGLVSGGFEVDSKRHESKFRAFLHMGPIVTEFGVVGAVGGRTGWSGGKGGGDSIHSEVS